MEYGIMFPPFPLSSWDRWLDSWFSYSAFFEFIFCHPHVAVMHLRFLLFFGRPHHCVRLMFIIECRFTAATIHLHDWMSKLHLRKNDVLGSLFTRNLLFRCYSDALHFIVIIMLFVMIMLGEYLKAVVVLLLTTPCRVRTWRKRNVVWLGKYNFYSQFRCSKTSESRSDGHEVSFFVFCRFRKSLRWCRTLIIVTTYNI